MNGSVSFIPISLSSFFPPPNSTHKLGQIKAADTEITEIRVCTNKTCRRQGSFETLRILSGIAPPQITVNSCGCLGRCGSGPNLVVLPAAAFVGHCGTAARVADVMGVVFGDESGFDWTKSLEALAMREKAEDEMSKGNFDQAEILLSQAIELKPIGGIHVIYKDRSIARLARSNMANSLEDAKEASTLDPKYPEAYICQGDVFMAMKQFDAAENSYSMALELDPSIRRSKPFKARIAQLQEKLTAGNLS